MRPLRLGTDLHRIGRRTFLRDLGRGTFAVAILGTAAVACGDDDDTESADGAATTDATDAPGDGAVGGSGGDFRWERVDLGFVSALVVARGNEAAIVDTGTKGSERELLAGLSALGLGWGDVGNVVLTHRHPDHQGSVEAVVAESGAVVSAGAADVEAIVGADVAPLDDGDDVFGLQVIATPGHTPGHISLYEPVARFLVAGDALNGADGGVTGPNPDFSTDHQLALAQVPKLAALDVEIAVFGHGPPVLSDATAAIAAIG